MKFLNRLFGRMPEIDSPPPPVAVWISLENLVSTEPDSPDLEEAELPDEGIFLDEVFTMIDYIDARGVETRRRVSLRRLAPGPNGPVLSAICHERKAIRKFRVNRIAGFIDTETGEITDAVSFLRELAGLDITLPEFSEPLAQAAKKVSEIANSSPLVRLREELRPQITVLVAIAKADGFVGEELDAILTFIETEASSPQYSSRFSGSAPQEIEAMAPFILKMRPRRSMLPDHLDAIAALDTEQIQRFERAVRCVIHADGEITEEEIAVYSIVDEWRQSLNT